MEHVKILVVRPNEEPVVELLSGDYRDIQKVVDGLFQVVYYCEPDLLVCNEEGKLIGLEPNRIIYQDGEVIDVIHGTFFICADDEEGDFKSLSDEAIDFYKEKFALRHVPSDWSGINRQLMEPFSMVVPLEF